MRGRSPSVVKRALLAAVVLFASACGSDTDEPARASTEITATGASSVETSTTSIPASDTSTSETGTSETSTSTAAVTVPVPECRDSWGPWSGDPELTWIEEGRLMTMSPDGPLCIGLARGQRLWWGPRGDRLLMDNQILSADGTMGVDLPGDATQVEWTRPTGLRMLYANPDGALSKLELDGSTSAVDLHEFPISAFAYHPDGLHIVLATEFGATFARNDGSNPGTLIQASDSVDIPQIEFSPDGTHLWFVAHHGADRHLHIVDLQEESRPADPDLDAILVPLGEDQNLLVDDIDLAGFVLDPRNRKLAAVSFGECGDAYTRIVTTTGQMGPAIEGTAIGFITDDGSTSLATTTGCEAKTLLLHQLDTPLVGESSKQITVASNVSAADIRDNLPLTLFSLEGVTLSGFT